MRKYLIRVARSVVSTSITFIIVFVILDLSYSYIGYFVLVMMVCILTDPLWQYTRKRLVFDASKHVADVERMIAELSRLRRIESDSHGSSDMLFATASKIRLFRRWKEKIEVATVDGVSTIEGNRFVVTRIARRMNKQIGK